MLNMLHYFKMSGMYMVHRFKYIFDVFHNLGFRKEFIKFKKSLVLTYLRGRLLKKILETWNSEGQ